MQQEERDRDIDDLVNLLEDQLFPAGFMTSFSDVYNCNEQWTCTVVYFHYPFLSIISSSSISNVAYYGNWYSFFLLSFPYHLVLMDSCIDTVTQTYSYSPITPQNVLHYASKHNISLLPPGPGSGLRRRLAEPSHSSIESSSRQHRCGSDQKQDPHGDAQSDGRAVLTLATRGRCERPIK